MFCVVRIHHDGFIHPSFLPSITTTDALYVQNNALTGDWPEEFCADGENPAGSESENGLTVVDDFGMDCDAIECSCCGILQCYY